MQEAIDDARQERTGDRLVFVKTDPSPLSYQFQGLTANDKKNLKYIKYVIYSKIRFVIPQLIDPYYIIGIDITDNDEIKKVINEALGVYDRTNEIHATESSPERQEELVTTEMHIWHNYMLGKEKEYGIPIRMKRAERGGRSRSVKLRMKTTRRKMKKSKRKYTRKH